jgi:predicted butyrate kinase (DUF1464 family)
MPRVIGIDPGTVSIDLCGLDGERLYLDRSLPTAGALSDPEAFVALLSEEGAPDLIAGPSGYGLPLVSAAEATDEDLSLAFLPGGEEPEGIGGLRRLARLLAASRLPVLYTPGVIHLPTVPSFRKINRIDLGTADKVSSTALAITRQAERLGIPLAATSLVLVELGGAFTAAVAVDHGRIVDGVGGTSGPIGWRSAGALDGEVAFLAGPVTKGLLFQGGVTSVQQEDRAGAMAAYTEGAVKAVLSLTASVGAPREILLSGRHSADAGVAGELEARLSSVAPVRVLDGFARVAKAGAQGAALIADGLAGGRHRELVEQLGLRQASGTALDHLYVVDRMIARRRLGLGPAEPR